VVKNGNPNINEVIKAINWVRRV